MARPIARTRLLVLLLWLFPLTVLSQGYEVSGECSLTGKVTLTIYDGDSSVHTYTDAIDRGLFFFRGAVAQPVLASITHPSMSQPLFFFLENSEISITLNATRPDASYIKGSRSNSEYRYILERYNASPDPSAFMRQYIRDNASSIYAPFFLYREMSNVDESAVRQCISQFKGAATRTYHFHLLRRWQEETPALSEGTEMPDFSFTNSNRKNVSYSQLRKRGNATLIYIGASWCDRCQQQLKQIERMLPDKSVTLISIRIDDHSAGWDAPYLKTLSVDHIPYLILVDADNLVQARDLRLWELENLIR